jgi:hypothetical protein
VIFIRRDRLLSGLHRLDKFSSLRKSLEFEPLLYPLLSLLRVGAGCAFGFRWWLWCFAHLVPTPSTIWECGSGCRRSG